MDDFAQGIGNAVEDIRHKVVEEGAYGRQVTPNSIEQQNSVSNDTMWDAERQMTANNTQAQDSQNTQNQSNEKMDYMEAPQPAAQEQPSQAQGLER